MLALSTCQVLSSTVSSAASTNATTLFSADRGVVYHVLVWSGVGQRTAHTIGILVTEPLVALLIIVVAWIVSRMERRLSLRIVASLRLVSPLVQSTPRGGDRARTIAGVISALFRIIIWVTAFLLVLGQFDVHLTAFVATATVLGAALGFGAQTLVKDFLSGVLIIAEDQYGVGDTIEVNNTIATVESVTLRVTRLRSLDGVVWYVPNGDIRTVGNHSEGTSQAVIDLQVPAGTDLHLAGRLAEEEGAAMAREPEWGREVISPPVFSGVQDEAVDHVTLRVLARTPPGHHFRVARELRLRILDRLAREGVAWARGAQKAEDRSPEAPVTADLAGPSPRTEAGDGAD